MRIANEDIVLISMYVFIFGIVWCVFIEPMFKRASNINLPKNISNTLKMAKTDVKKVDETPKNEDLSKTE